MKTTYENVKQEILELLTPATNTDNMCISQRELYSSLLKSMPEWMESFSGTIPFDFDYLPTRYKLLFKVRRNAIDILHSNFNPYDKQNLRKILTISFKNNEITYSQKEYYKKSSLSKNKYCVESYDKRQQDVFYKNKDIVIYTNNDDVHILISKKC